MSSRRARRQAAAKRTRAGPKQGSAQSENYLKSNSPVARGTVKGRTTISNPILNGRSTRGYLGGSALNFRNATSSPRIALTSSRAPLKTFGLPCSDVKIVRYVAQPVDDNSRTNTGTIDTNLGNLIPFPPCQRPAVPSRTDHNSGALPSIFPWAST